MKPFVRHAVLTMLILSALGFLAAFVMVWNGGLSAEPVPGTLEEHLANRVLHLSIPSAKSAAVNPYASNPNAWRTGSDVFSGQCAMCHGDDGRGGTDIGSHMYPRVPDLSIARVQGFSDGALFSIIQTGIRMTGMPGFRSSISEEDTWKLVSFVRKVPSLSRAALEQPSVTPASAGTAPANTVTIDGTAFQPVELTVSVGAKVTWVNKDPFPHNVDSTAGGFHSGTLAPDQTWTFDAAKAGDYPYVCTLHPGMKGTLHVK